MRIFPAFLTVSFLFAIPILQSAPNTVKEKPESDGFIIDVSGSLNDLPLGTTEEKVIAKLGKPSGSIHFDEKRSGLIYSKSLMLLFYENLFDGIRISSSIIDWQAGRWLQNHAHFPTSHWKLTNGIHKEIELDELVEILKIPPQEQQNHRIFWSNEYCDWSFDFGGFSHSGGKDSEVTYKLVGLLLTRKHEGENYWPNINLRIASNNRLAGKKMLGFQMRSTKSGMRTLFIYKDSPADKAGIQSGDLIEKINDTPTKGMTSTEFSALLEKADTHQLHIIPRTPGKQPFTVTLTKADGSRFADGVISGSRLDFLEVGEGQIAPDFTALTSAGKEIRLTDFKARPVLIHFTATWCQPCREQTPQLVRLYQKFGNRGLEFVSIYLDDSSKDVMAYSKNLGISWPVRNDGATMNGEAALAYGPVGVPNHILVGSDGTILKTGLHHSNLEEKLSELLGP
jgi:thiol-disulfide isomerase/thioredoxin